MKNLINTIRNIFKIDDLKTRILNTLLFILMYRLISHVVLPGVDHTQLAGLKNQTSGGILSLLDMFAGGAFSQASIVALGIMPYISASIVVQLLGIAVPYFQRMQKEGESGRKKIKSIYTLSHSIGRIRTSSRLSCKFTLTSTKCTYLLYAS